MFYSCLHKTAVMLRPFSNRLPTHIYASIVVVSWPTTGKTEEGTRIAQQIDIR